ncbi:uncharacterized protein LOC120250068 [Dioscorea cayenensis subsp. rotundata]|uniref:Uncharacterized protein LOC120250068 n=1 Tax=Dioscorea cayennensis subsp. rotundata TaxID=55577 RepID=A0AB40AIS9_DIOCR|nr:uncharacterized protein LOC120250068 [Dioscorea cayenensis subsp. rotundata]
MEIHNPGAVPNIESRIKLFRSKTTAIADILQISGFVWNFEICTIECEKSAYDEYVKNHKKEADLYGKAFPFFNDLVAVFARDRAHGSTRGDIGDDADQNLHENVTLDDDTGFFQFGSDDVCMDTQEPILSPSPIGSETSTSRVRRKRKSVVDQSSEKIPQNLNHFVEVIGPGFKTLADVAAHKVARDEACEAREKAHYDALAEIVKMKNMLPQVLFEIDGLSEDEALFILQVLPKDDDQMKIFFELPDNKKLRFCHILLSRLSFKAPNM